MVFVGLQQTITLDLYKSTVDHEVCDYGGGTQCGEATL